MLRSQFDTNLVLIPWTDLKDRIFKIKQYLDTDDNIYTGDNKSKYFSNPKEILNSAKKNYENSTPSKLPQPAITEFLSKIPDRKKISNGHFNFSEAEMSLDEIMKSINSETNNKSPGNDGLMAEFYKQFSKKLAPVLLDVYDSWGKLGTMAFTSRTGISMVFYRKNARKKILQNYSPNST